MELSLGTIYYKLLANGDNENRPRCIDKRIAYYAECLYGSTHKRRVTKERRMSQIITYLLLVMTKPFMSRESYLRFVCWLFKGNAFMFFDAIILLQFHKGKGIPKVQKLVHRILLSSVRKEYLTTEAKTFVQEKIDARVVELYQITQMR